MLSAEYNFVLYWSNTTQIDFRLFNDAVSTAEVIYHRIMWEDDHGWQIGR
jgi:hypothetical protein